MPLAIVKISGKPVTAKVGSGCVDTPFAAPGDLDRVGSIGVKQRKILSAWGTTNLEACTPVLGFTTGPMLSCLSERGAGSVRSNRPVASIAVIKNVEIAIGVID